MYKKSPIHEVQKFIWLMSGHYFPCKAYLVRQAKRLGVKNTSRMRKAELFEAIDDALAKLGFAPPWTTAHMTVHMLGGLIETALAPGNVAARLPEPEVALAA